MNMELFDNDTEGIDPTKDNMGNKQKASFQFNPQSVGTL